jgi:hypothetical protein
MKYSSACSIDKVIEIRSHSISDQLKIQVEFGCFFIQTSIGFLDHSIHGVLKSMKFVRSQSSMLSTIYLRLVCSWFIPHPPAIPTAASVEAPGWFQSVGNSVSADNSSFDRIAANWYIPATGSWIKTIITIVRSRLLMHPRAEPPLLSSRCWLIQAYVGRQRVIVRGCLRTM